MGFRVVGVVVSDSGYGSLDICCSFLLYPECREPGAYLAHFMGRFFQCSSGPPSQINMLYSNESIY